MELLPKKAIIASLRLVSVGDENDDCTIDAPGYSL
jgi:hypothetical protein